MKKAVIISVVAIMLTVCFLATGCSLFGEEKDERIVVTLNVDGETYERKVNEGDEYIELPEEIMTKKGYVFKGFFDSEADGECYINTSGDTSAAWRRTFPTVLYAQWKDADGYVLAENHKWVTSPQQFFGEKVFSFSFAGGCASAIKGNPDYVVKVRLDFKIQCPPYVGVDGSPTKERERSLVLQDFSGTGAESYAHYSFTVLGVEYNEESVILAYPAKAFTNGTFNGKPAKTFYLKFYGSPYFPTYVKDIYITATILKA